MGVELLGCGIREREKSRSGNERCNFFDIKASDQEFKKKDLLGIDWLKWLVA